MDTSQEQSHYIQQTQIQKIAPHLIQASEILQCTTQELRQAIERELMENPALESVETASDRCADCNMPPLLCTNCPFAERRTLSLESSGGDGPADGATDAKKADDEPERETFDDVESEGDYDLAPLMAMSDMNDQVARQDFLDDAFDPLSLAPSHSSLTDHILSRLRSMSGDGRNYKIYEYLVQCLDERGWLKIDRTEAMVELSITEDVLDEAIAALQTCDPPGVGARDLRECLLIQLHHLDEDGAGNRLALTIVDKYWDMLHQRRFDQLARRTGSTQTAIAAAVRFIQNELSPAPATQYREPWDYKPDSSMDSVKPDVIIRRTATGFDVEVTGVELPTLHINSRYRRLYETIREERKNKVANGGSSSPVSYGIGRASAAQKLSADERKHIAQYVERANLFVKNIQQRRKSIERITRCLIEAQQGFIETGSRSFLIPMTRTDLARSANLHESTVSRALLRKYVQLPTQDVIAFEAFFAAAGSVKDMIAAMIANENSSSPYSDETLRLKLEEMGISVARRTIVKYRESLRIPASYMRRKH